MRTTNSLRNTPQTEAHIYPPPPRTMSESSSPQPSLHPIPRLNRFFAFRRRHGELNSLSLSSDRVTEFGASEPSPPNSSTSTSSDESPRGPEVLKKLVVRQDPPTVVSSWRYKAEAQTFTVRIEPEFTVTCTVVQPTLRFHLSWPSRPKFKKIRRAMPCRPYRDDGRNLEGPDAPKKAKRKSRGGVAIVQDTCDNALSLVQHSPEPRPREQQQTQQEKRIKNLHRNSGWAGVFCNDALQQPSSSSNSSSSHERASFTIDRTSRMLVVPDVDIGVAYSVKREIENLKEARHGFTTDTDETDELHGFGRSSGDSWLDLE